MIPSPMVRLREMAPEWAEWIGADVRGSAWFQHFPSWLTDSGSASPRPFWALQLDRGQVKVWGAPESRNTPHPFALNLRTGAAKFPDGTTIPEAVWMRYYRARPVVMNRARAEEIARGHATRGGNSFEMDIERAADAIMEAVAESRQWLPIESAPKDGSYILVTNDEAGGAWIATWKPVFQSGYRPENPWQCMMLNRDHLPNKLAPAKPTRWQPLPQPPSAAKDSQ